MLIPHLENITALAAGAQHVLALDSKGTVYGWGAKKLDQLSTKTSNRVPGASMVPHACSMTKPGKFKDVVSIGAGAFHSFAVLRNGEVYAWGYNKYGQTGIPDHFTATGFQIHSTTIPYATRVPVFEEKQLFVDYITGGFKHSVAVTKDNMCLSWGSIADAALGIQAADMDDQEIVYESATVKTPLVLKEPGRATGIGQSVAATTGPTHTLVISSKGVAFGNVAFGWGSNRQYETSIIQQAETLLPSELRGNGLDGKTVVAVAAGKEFSVLLTE
ncbi:regulator of chromosome condensation 1/beta-lactamase-inhibitor protein II [Aspergillus californicus]